MAPKKAKPKPKVSSTEAAAAAAAPSIPRSKRSKTSATAATAAQDAEEANNSTHGGVGGNNAGGVTREAYEVIQRELADLRQEMLGLRQPAEGTLTVPARSMPAAVDNPPSAPLLRGDPNSPLSPGLEATRWPSGFKMPEVTPF